MKRAWIVMLVAVLALPAAAVAQDSAWCGGTHSEKDGTNFTTCMSSDRDIQVAGRASGLRRQDASAPSFVDYSATVEAPGSPD
jgi:hypothetical protein